MICSIYGDSKTVPVGVIQLFNKKSKDGITKQDKQKLVAIQGLLGM